MTNNIYLLRDKVAQTFGFSFPAVNDGSAVRYVSQTYGKSPLWHDLELWRFSYGFDVQTGDPVQCEKAVIALPELPSGADNMPLSAGSATVETK